MASSKKNFLLKGLDCASCANKIESELKKIQGVTKVSVNFVSTKLEVELDTNNEYSVIENIIKRIKNIEPKINIVSQEQLQNKKDKELVESENRKYKLWMMILGALIFFLTVAIKLPEKIEFILYFISYILLGGDIVLKAIRNIFRGEFFDENFLMSIATIGAFVIKQFPEGVAVMLFYKLGESFQSYAVNKSRKSISALMDIRPDYANLKINNETKKVSPEEVNIGDHIIVKAGEKIPLDGTVIDGVSMIDTSALTGESVPVKVEKGSNVLSGAINNNGVLTIAVSKKFSESTVSKILDLVENASSNKSETENFITKFAKYYTPIVVIIAIGLAIIPPILLKNGSWNEWIYRALVFLVISCPCALVISIPLGFFAGIGSASKNGILVKGSNYLEALNSVDTVVFDKTGTLTKGVFKVTTINAIGINEDELLEYAAYAEYYSNHPIGVSIVKAYSKDINKNEINDYNEISGHGLSVTVKGKKIFAGNTKLMRKENIKYEETEELGTIVHMAINNTYYGYIIISDEIKEDSKEAINGLRDIGIKRIVMLTGDSKKVGESVAKQLELNDVKTELLPDEKVKIVQQLYEGKSKNTTLVFVGDGINDAPVLAIADVGVAMGGVGSDAAIEAADVVIMNDEPSKLINGIKVARKTKKIVGQNITIALVTKGIVLILGAIGMTNMWEAVFADVGVTLIAVLNSMRILKKGI